MIPLQKTLSQLTRERAMIAARAAGRALAQADSALSNAHAAACRARAVDEDHRACEWVRLSEIWLGLGE